MSEQKTTNAERTYKVTMLNNLNAAINKMENAQDLITAALVLKDTASLTDDEKALMDKAKDTSTRLVVVMSELSDILLNVGYRGVKRLEDGTIQISSSEDKQ
ncbi:MAG: hypothetical protein [Caudoviricetes sp.]|nr:MAG: hypothetical protein [Caudoviricetes sp.]